MAEVCFTEDSMGSGKHFRLSTKFVLFWKATGEISHARRLQMHQRVEVQHFGVRWLVVDPDDAKKLQSHEEKAVAQPGLLHEKISLN